jgi:AcrR family transcriptional regulator
LTRPILLGMTVVATARRPQLLAELVELFLAEGFRHLTLEEMARRLRCSKSTLYDVGPSKEQLTVNVVRHFFAVSAEEVERRTAAEEDPATRIVTYLQAVADALRRASQRFFEDLAAHPATHAVYQRNTGAAARRVREMIAEGVASGHFREVHAAFVANVVAETMARIQSGEVLRSVSLRDAEAYEELAALILDGISS